jgi:hypothetical protein
MLWRLLRVVFLYPYFKGCVQKWISPFYSISLQKTDFFLHHLFLSFFSVLSFPHFDFVVWHSIMLFVFPFFRRLQNCHLSTSGWSRKWPGRELPLGAVRWQVPSQNLLGNYCCVLFGSDAGRIAVLMKVFSSTSVHFLSFTYSLIFVSSTSSCLACCVG